MATSLSIFFGSLGVSVVVILIIYIIAKKYTKGDFVKLQQQKNKKGKSLQNFEEDFTQDIAENTVEESEENSALLFTPTKARSEIRNTGFEGGKFVSKAVVLITLQYYEDTQRLAGVIKSVERWDTEAHDCPNEINFHFKLFPKKTLRGQTVNKKVKNKILSLSFFVGPVQYEDLLNSSLCVRMYGRGKRVISQFKCYGECFIPVNPIVGLKEPKEFRKKLMPKAIYIPKDNEEFYFSSGTENEIAEARTPAQFSEAIVSDS